MIKDKLKLYLSFVFLLISMLLNLPFPHRYPYGEIIFKAMNIPIRFSNGFHTVGIVALLLMLIGLYLLVKSLNRFHSRMVIFGFLAISFVPLMLIGFFQTTFATGIYAVSYSKEESICDFDMIGRETMHGSCELIFTNYSKDDVRFRIDFHELLPFEDDLPMVSLMNHSGPHEVYLEGKENKMVYIKANIDVSEMDSYIESGVASNMDITIKAKGKKRDL